MYELKDGRNFLENFIKISLKKKEKHFFGFWFHCSYQLLIIMAARYRYLLEGLPRKQKEGWRDVGRKGGGP